MTPLPTLSGTRGRATPRSPVLSHGRRFAELVRIGRRHGLLPWTKLDFSKSPARLLRQGLLSVVAVVCGVLSLSYLTREPPQDPGAITPFAAGVVLGALCVVLLLAVLVSWVRGRHRGDRR